MPDWFNPISRDKAPRTSGCACGYLARRIADCARLHSVGCVFAGVDMRASLSAFAGLTRPDRRIASPAVGDPLVIDVRLAPRCG
jgi:hypothetical protein